MQASFEAAQQEPVHAKNPSLKAVEITPGKPQVVRELLPVRLRQVHCRRNQAELLWLCAVLPDFDRWEDHHVLLEFEGDPSDHPRLQKLTAEKRRQLAGMRCTWTGIMK